MATAQGRPAVASPARRLGAALATAPPRSLPRAPPARLARRSARPALARCQHLLREREGEGERERLRGGFFWILRFRSGNPWRRWEKRERLLILSCIISSKLATYTDTILNPLLSFHLTLHSLFIHLIFLYFIYMNILYKHACIKYLYKYIIVFT